MVTKSASIAGGASAIPVIGVDAASDVMILLELIKKINKAFGLSDAQIESYPSAEKQMIHHLIKQAGLALVGTQVTKIAVKAAVKQVAKRVALKQALKFIPIIGWGINAAIGFGAMKYVGNSHVDDCYNLAKKIIENSFIKS